LRLLIFILPVRRPRPKFNDKVAKIFCSRSRKTCGNNFRFHFYCVSPHLCEILIAILSVRPSVTFRCSKKQQTHRKADGAKRPQSGVKRPVSGRNVQGRNVLGAKRPRGETSRGRNVQGAKRQRGETSCYLWGCPSLKSGVVFRLLLISSMRNTTPDFRLGLSDGEWTSGKAYTDGSCYYQWRAH